ncbi:fasciclin domain-containing protein [Niabella yanshanensis]|uniref:Fasciclin domain-containing protein n=1 Tax=Niabella yanshanensis TaxID=577386 RepID=A0ABZ0W3K0_9BACT|nr:fasciclin domain-containing protein [Niabella yanshanensis]WQD37853.1 fasciclin domain-containing protein [Niabella yanshanensis]
MKKRITKSFVACLLLLCFTACRKSTWDEFYGKPDNLAKPIYTVLKEKGNFTHLLKAIDKADYTRTLDAAGYWTFFAPDDAAFSEYFADKGISSIDQLSAEECRNIVTYCLTYYAYKKERIDDYQSSSGWVADQAFRRRTANYKGVYDDIDATGTTRKAIGSNRNGTLYQDNDNNHKYIPYFVDNFMTGKSLSAADYNYFYPNSNFTGFNVANAAVKEADITAENGVIHVIDKVIEALPNLEDYLQNNDQYSIFNSLYQKYLVSYVPNPTMTRTHQVLNGGNEQVYTKFYDPGFAFSLNNENFIQSGNDAQINSYSVFAPKNDVMQAYIDTALLKHYTSLDQMPPSIIQDFLNAHMWQEAVWPSQFESAINFVGEEARFDPATNIVEKKILSNGMFYGTNKVQNANVFTSVYGNAYLNPNYSMMITLLNLELRTSVSNIYNNYTIFMISNQMFNDAGYTVDQSISTLPMDQWRYTPPAGSTIPASTGATTRARLQRILNLHVVPNSVLSNLTGPGIAMTYGGEYLRYINNTVYTAGNVDSNTVVTTNGFENAINGRVYYSDRIMEFSEETVGQDIELIGTPESSPYHYFWNFLNNSTALWNNTTKLIAGVANGSFYTVLIPTNAAIQQAVNDGVLPGTGTAPDRVPNFNPDSELERQQVARFIQYHILERRTIGTDGVESGAIPTVLKNNLGEPTTIFVNNSVGNMQLTDMHSRRANTILANSNYLANRALIHSIDNYLRYVY